MNKYYITKGGTGVRRNGDFFYYDFYDKWIIYKIRKGGRSILDLCKISKLGNSPLDIDHEISEIYYREICKTDRF